MILTASGGAFRDLSKDELFKMCKEDPRAVQAKATTHPNWDMGAKITLDSGKSALVIRGNCLGQTLIFLPRTKNTQLP